MRPQIAVKAIKSGTPTAVRLYTRDNQSPYYLKVLLFLFKTNTETFLYYEAVLQYSRFLPQMCRFIAFPQIRVHTGAQRQNS